MPASLFAAAAQIDPTPLLATPIPLPLPNGPNPACVWSGFMTGQRNVYYHQTGITGYDRGFLIRDGNYDTVNNNIDYTIEYLEDPMDCSGERFIVRFPMHGLQDHVEIEVYDEATGSFLGGLEASKGSLPNLYDQSNALISSGPLGPFVITDSMMNQVNRILLFPLLDTRTLTRLPLPAYFNGAAPANALQELFIGLAYEFSVGQREPLYDLFTFRRSLVGMVASAKQRASDAIDAHIYDAGVFTATIWQDHPFVDHSIDVTPMIAGVTYGGLLNGHRHYLAEMESHLNTLSDSQRTPFRRIPAWRSEQTIPAEFDIGINSTTTSQVMPASYEPSAICSSYDPALYVGATLFDQMVAAQSDYEADVEPWHGSTHVEVGGDMASVATAGKTPIFFAWHSSIDSTWRNWQLCWPAWNPTDYSWL